MPSLSDRPGELMVLERRPGAHALGALGLCVVMAMMSIGVMQRATQQAAAVDGNAYDAVGRGVANQQAAEPGLFTARSISAEVANGLFLARGAASLPEEEDRSRLLARAIAMVEPYRQTKPYWGEASAILAYAYGLENHRDARFPAMLAESYAEAPYMRQSAYWRVQAGVSLWNRLDDVTRHRVVDEAVWFTRVNNSAIGTLLPLFRGTPAYQPFMLRRLEQRVGDRDFPAIKGMSQQKPGQ